MYTNPSDDIEVTIKLSALQLLKQEIKDLKTELRGTPSSIELQRILERCAVIAAGYASEKTTPNNISYKDAYDLVMDLWVKSTHLNKDNKDLLFDVNSLLLEASELESKNLNELRKKYNRIDPTIYID